MDIIIQALCQTIIPHNIINDLLITFVCSMLILQFGYQLSRIISWLA